MSFQSIFQLMQENHSPLISTNDEEDYNILNLIKKGNYLNKDFWQELRQLASHNSKGLSKLLGVHPEIVAKWPNAIEQHLIKVQEINNKEIQFKRPQIIPTGDLNINKTN